MLNKTLVKPSVLLAAALVLAAGVPARGQERSLDLRPPLSAERFVLAAADAVPPSPAVSSMAEGMSPRQKWLVGGIAVAVIVVIAVVASNSSGSSGGGGGGGGGY